MNHDQLAAALIQSSPDGLLLVEEDGTIVLANPIVASMFRVAVDELVGSSVEDLVPDHQRAEHRRHRGRYVEHATTRPMGTGLRLFGQAADGTVFPVEISLSPVTIEDRLLTIATIRDVTERQESAAEMATLHERERIARDLHDMIIQRLFATGMSLQAVQAQAKPTAVADRITATINELDETIRELRAAIFRLGQTGERRSLSAQLTELIADRSHQLGFEPEFHLTGDLDHLPEFIADQLVATVSEGLSNVARHADASAAKIYLEHIGTKITLRIADNGRGLPEVPKRSGGLSNMMWRAAELGGSCTVGANDPAGTALFWEVPV